MKNLDWSFLFFGVGGFLYNAGNTERFLIDLVNIEFMLLFSLSLKQNVVIDFFIETETIGCRVYPIAIIYYTKLSVQLPERTTLRCSKQLH